MRRGTDGRGGSDKATVIRDLGDVGIDLGGQIARTLDSILRHFDHHVTHAHSARGRRAAIRDPDHHRSPHRIRNLILHRKR